MRKLISLVLCLLLLLTAALAEDKSTAGQTTEASQGAFDAPALTHPEERYTDYFVQQTDGSEASLFIMLMAQNDPDSVLEACGAILRRDHVSLNTDGSPRQTYDEWLQETPVGRMQIHSGIYLLIRATQYAVGERAFVEAMGDLSPADQPFTQEQFDYLCDTFLFPYYTASGCFYPEILNGVRQDENGYAYFFIGSDDATAVEYVTGESMRIVQTRLYKKDADGVFALEAYSDYIYGEPKEVPQAVLDAFAESSPAH